jgi:hypothetical protein
LSHLLANLVGEDAEGVGAVEVAGELAHRLGHHPGLQADALIAHCALELGLRRKRGHRVDRHHVHRARADQQVGDLERLLAVVGLRDEQLVHVHADALGVGGVHGVLGVDERADAAHPLRAREHVVEQRGLAGGLGPEHLDDAAPGNAADAEGEVERQRAGGDGLDPHRGGLVPHLHDRPLAELPLDLAERVLQRRLAGLSGFLLLFVRLRHVRPLESSGMARVRGRPDGRSPPAPDNAGTPPNPPKTLCTGVRA